MVQNSESIPLKIYDESQSALEVVPDVTSIPSTGTVQLRYCLKDQDGEAYADANKVITFGTEMGTSTGTFSSVLYDPIDHCYESDFTGVTAGTPVDFTVSVDAVETSHTHDMQVTAPRLSFTNDSRPTVAIENRVFPVGAPDWSLTGNCDPFLGDVLIKGGIDADATTSCQSDGTFSVSIDTGGTDSPYFIQQGDPLIQIKQGALQPVSTRLYMTLTTWTNVFITTHAELQAMTVSNSQQNRNYFLKNDIDFSLISATNNFIPRGTTSSSYWSGRLYGDGKRILNMHINGGGGQYKGLIGYATSHAQIFDLHFENAVVINSTTAGVLAGMMRQTLAKAIRVSAQGSVSGTYGLGILIGQMWDSSVFDSWTSGSVSGATSSEMGGIVGTFRGGEIHDSWSDAVISGSAYAGGLVGNSFPGFKVIIERSFATGDVSITSEGAGGLAGKMEVISGDDRVIDSFALGNVTAPATYSCYPSGPFIGFLEHFFVSCGEGVTTTYLNNMYLSTATCTGCSPQFTRATSQSLDAILANIRSTWDFEWKWKMNTLGTRPELIDNPGSAQ